MAYVGRALVAPPCFRIALVKRILPALLIGVCLSLAQTRKPSSPVLSSSRLISVTASGSQRYSSEDIVAATGLEQGHTAREEDFKGAAEFLGKTGAFTDVAYNYQVSQAGTRLELHVTDANPFVPAHFDDFVWLSEQDLLQKLHARVPLFHGELPVNGDLPDQVSEALQALAIELHLQGRADYLRAGAPDGPTEAFDFAITGQTIRLRNVIFAGAGPEELPLLEAAAGKLPVDYSRSALRQAAQKNCLPVYLARGSLRAKIDGPEAKVVENSPDGTVVDAVFAVTPGVQYKLTEINLTGFQVFPVEQLRSLMQLRTGHPADAVAAGKDIESLKRFYGTRGYMGAHIQLVPLLHDADATATFRFDFTEGRVYKMGDLDVRGLDSRATARLVAAWKLQPGSTYDSSYLPLFLTSRDVAPLADDWKIDVHETAEDKETTVDVTLRFERRAR